MTDQRPLVEIRPWEPSDRHDLQILLDVHSAVDHGWPPDGAGDLLEWMAAPCTLGRWVATRDGVVVAHTGLAAVTPDALSALWTKATGVEPTGLAEVVRGVVHPSERRRGTASRLTGHVMDVAIARGLVPVACALTDREASLAMMHRYGWRRVRETIGRRTGRPIAALVPPDSVVSAAIELRWKS
jgi:GNAT superfamily N-acetyltransferase